jgi:hypothetical protein
MLDDIVQYLSLLSCFVHAKLLFVHLCICELCNVLRDSCLRHKTTRSVVAHYWRFYLFIAFHLSNRVFCFWCATRACIAVVNRYNFLLGKHEYLRWLIN